MLCFWSSFVCGVSFHFCWLRDLAHKDQCRLFEAHPAEHHGTSPEVWRTNMSEFKPMDAIAALVTLTYVCQRCFEFSGYFPYK